jgi:CheY-like chemotaxis protein
VAFDVVLMDLQMPVMDGIEACRLIHARPGGSDDGVTHPIAQVVFVTASVSVAIREDCEVAGAIDFVAKPCNVSMIQACLERIVAMHNV